MRADYDVVILGDSYSARWAARYAIRQHARVALVLQSAAAEIGAPATRQALADLITGCGSQALPFSTIQGLRQWIQRRSKVDEVGLELTRLSQLGVDVIPEAGHFIAAIRKAPVFAVAHRPLRSRRYLLACDPIPQQRIDAPNRYHSLHQFLETLEAQQQPINLCLTCSQPWILTLGQILNRLGHQVILSATERLLPFEDPEISFLVQCGLESEGIQVQQKIDHDNTDTLYFEPQGISVLPPLKLDPIIPIEPPHPEPRLGINPDFSTAHPRVYAAANLFHPYASAEVIQHHNAIALNNLLFDLNHFESQHPIAQAIPLGVGFCRRGLTEPEARHRFDDVEVMARHSGLQDQSIFCKLIASRQGEILGMHLLGLPGSQGQALLQQIFAQSPTLYQLDEFIIAHPVLQQMLHDFADRWRQLKLPRIRDRRERYFRKKRKQFS